MDERITVVLTTNSPGEVAGWVRPAVPAVRRAGADRVFAFLPPCLFASGAEKRVVAAIPGVDGAFDAGEYWGFVLRGRHPEGFAPSRRGVVLFLGGDLMHAVWLGRRLRYPVLAYTERPARWGRVIERFFVPHEGARSEVARRGIPPDKVEVVGELVLDAVQPRRDRTAVRRALGIAPDAPVLALFPGSRQFELERMTPLCLAAADRAARAVPGLRCVLALSPFATPSGLARALPQDAWLEPAGEGWRIVGATADPIDVLHDQAHELMQASDLGLTVPGTNTLEAAFLGLPLVVALPLDEPEKIPLEGLAGYLDAIPLVGRRLKAAAVLRAAARARFVALPNRRAGTELVPEVRGRVGADEIARVVIEWLRDDRRRQAAAARLRQIAGAAGAADLIARQVVAKARGSADGRPGSGGNTG